jgi:zinc protease
LDDRVMRPSSLGWKRWLPGMLTLAVAGGLAVRKCGGPAATETPPARQSPVAQAGQAAAGPATDGPDFAEWSAGFAHQQAPPTELRAQPEACAGTLGNGLRHVVMADPSDGGLSLRLVVMAGSLHEADAEQGLAHWVEHMAFRGTAGHAGESALNAFERLGSSPGADSNATTSCGHTVYRLDLPEASAETVEAALRFFRKVAGGLEFPAAEVEAERLVMLREFDERQGAGGFAHRAAVLLPDTRAGRRPPIGKRGVLERATPAMVARFWQRHYVPENMRRGIWCPVFGLQVCCLVALAASLWKHHFLAAAAETVADVLGGHVEHEAHQQQREGRLHHFQNARLDRSAGD